MASFPGHTPHVVVCGLGTRLPQVLIVELVLQKLAELPKVYSSLLQTDWMRSDS